MVGKHIQPVASLCCGLRWRHAPLADNAVATGPYAPCGAWSDALFGHGDRPDGIAYSSRHDPEQTCIALFSRPDIVPEVLGGPTPLADMPAEVAAVLRRYGKGLIP